MTLLVAALVLAGTAQAEQRRIEVTAEPESILLGTDKPTDVKLTIRILDVPAGAPPAELLIHTTAGTVSKIESAGTRKYRATLHAPARAFPQIAVVTVADVAPALDGKPPLVGRASVAYKARLDLRGKTEPGARMMITLSGRPYGPARADAKGRFVVPIIVEPGEGFAFGLATDALGNKSESDINLYLPVVKQVHAFAYPDALVADGRDHGWLFVTTVDTTGRPLNKEAKVTVSAGTLGAPEQLGPGIVRHTFTAPATLGEDLTQGQLEFQIDAGGESLETTDVVRLVPGPPAAMEATPPPQAIVSDGKATGEARVVVLDAQGHRSQDFELIAKLDGQVLGTRVAEDGATIVDLPPRAFETTHTLTLEAKPRARFCIRPRFIPDEPGPYDARGLPCDESVSAMSVAVAQAPAPAVTEKLAIRWEAAPEPPPPELPPPTDQPFPWKLWAGAAGGVLAAASAGIAIYFGVSTLDSSSLLDTTEQDVRSGNLPVDEAIAIIDAQNQRGRDSAMAANIGIGLAIGTAVIGGSLALWGWFSADSQIQAAVAPTVNGGAEGLVQYRW